MRVHADRRADPFGQSRRQGHRGARGREITADADHDETPDPDGARALQHRVRSRGKVLRVEMAVRVYERHGEDGIPPRVIAEPTRSGAFTVFAQQARPALAVDVLVQQAARFFGTTLAVGGVEGRDAADLGAHAAAARLSANGDARLCFGRARSDDDLAAATDAESRAGYTGMSLLAARCGTVWLVEVARTDDRAALLFAAVLASVVLGPILSPDGNELFGVKTARAKLER